MTTGYNPEGYIQRLERLRRERLELDQKKAPSISLKDQIQKWWDKLPAEERQQHYRMEFFAEKFSPVFRLIGPVLHDLGWERKRVWAPNRPHHRVWCPPVRSD